jgi:hypothetical protein
MKAPKLTCMISGQSRVTSYNYLKQKADRIHKSVEWLLKNYVAKNVCSQLRKGTAVTELTEDGKAIDDTRLTDLVKNNSKCREIFSFIDGVYTPLKPTTAPKAPKVISSTIADAEARGFEPVVKTTVSLESMVHQVADKFNAALVTHLEQTVPAKTSDEVLLEMVTEPAPF